MITAEDAGNIFARLAIADEAFLAYALQAASNAGDSLIFDDLENLEKWARFIRILRTSIEACPTESSKG